MTVVNSTLLDISKDVFQSAALGTKKSIQDEDFLTHIPQPLQSFVQTVIEVDADIDSDAPSSEPKAAISISERIDKFEVSTRGQLLSHVNTLLKSNDDAATIKKNVVDLLSFIRNVIDVVLHFKHYHQNKNKVADTKINTNGDDNDNDANDEDKNKNEKDGSKEMYSKLISIPNFRKLPFLLLEDLVDTLPTQTIQQFWNYGPSLWLNDLLCKEPKSNNSSGSSSGSGSKSKDTNLTLFQYSSQLCMLRFCNKILRNLSVASSNAQAQFAGQIKMTLASVFPLSEKSAVNITGKFNVESVVEFESLDDWWKTNNEGSGKTTGSGSNGGSSKDSGNSSGMTLNYDFYKTFWGLQQTFTNPTILLKKDVGNKADNWNENMSIFVKNAETVLGAFESNLFPDRLVKDMKDRWKDAKKTPIVDHLTQESKMDIDDDDNGNGNDVKMKEKDSNSEIDDNNSSKKKTSSKRQYKYMTNSQLLHLQLQDPEIRMHILTQLFIISAYLKQSLLKNEAVNKMSVERVCGDLTKLEHRAGELLKSTPPNGEVQYTTLTWMLKEREPIWRNWKRSKCETPIEKFHNAKNTNDENDTSKEPKRKRRMLIDGPLGSINGKEQSPLASMASLYSYKIDIKSELSSISKAMASKYTPNTTDYLNKYVEAIDPESGIEGEWHPKNDKLFAWRAMRLLNKQYVGRLGIDEMGFQIIDPKNGDFEGLVRKMWKEEKGIDIPGKMPMPDEIVEEEEIQEKEAKNEDGEEIQSKESQNNNDEDEGNDKKEAKGTSDENIADRNMMDAQMEAKDTVLTGKDTVKESTAEAGEVKDDVIVQETKDKNIIKSDEKPRSTSTVENIKKEPIPDSGGQKRKRETYEKEPIIKAVKQDEGKEEVANKESPKQAESKPKTVNSNESTKTQQSKPSDKGMSDKPSTDVRPPRSQKGTTNNATADNRQSRSNNHSAPSNKRVNDRRGAGGTNFAPPQGRGNMSRNPPNDGRNDRRHTQQQQQQQQQQQHHPHNRRPDGRYQDNGQNTGPRNQFNARGEDRGHRGNHGGSRGGHGGSGGGQRHKGGGRR